MLNIFKEQNKNMAEQSATPTPTPTKRADFRKYIDTSREFGTTELTRAMWYMKHKALLYRMAVLGLAGFSVITLGYSLWQLGDYVIFGINADQQLAVGSSQFIDYTLIQPHFAPQPFQIVSTRILTGGVNKYDVVAELSNPNNQWLTKFDYYFVVDGAPLPRQQGWLLPGETRPWPYLGLERTGGSPGSANVVIENVTWQRISNKTILDPLAWQADRLRFTVSDFVFTRSDSFATTTASAHIIQFKLTNDSAYSYATPFFYVGLFNNGSLVQMMPLKLTDLGSLEGRAIDLRSFVPNLQVADVQIFPVINLYDASVYAAPPS